MEIHNQQDISPRRSPPLGGILQFRSRPQLPSLREGLLHLPIPKRDLPHPFPWRLQQRLQTGPLHLHGDNPKIPLLQKFRTGGQDGLRSSCPHLCEGFNEEKGTSGLAMGIGRV